MSTREQTIFDHTRRARRDRAAALVGASTGRALLGGALAAPLFFVVALGQAATRDGFDLRTHTISLLSNGHLGWIQIANFVVAGLLFAGAGLALRPRLAATRAGRWTARLVTVFGLGLIGAGVFVADPAYGFPPGTPTGAPASVSWHGALHLVVGGIGFLALITATFSGARYLNAQRRRGKARTSRAIGTLFLLGLAGLGANTAVTNVAFVLTAALAFGWASCLALLALRAARC